MNRYCECRLSGAEAQRKWSTGALTETRIRGVKTNIPFIVNVLRHPQFQSGEATTSFIGDSPELFEFALRQNRGNKVHFL